MDILSVYIIVATLCAFCISVSLTPVVRTLAFRFKVTDIPKDNRRMHKKEMPLMGGVAIFLAFVISSLIFCKVDRKIIGMLIGCVIVVVTGIIDDKYSINAFIKLFFQIAAGSIAVFSGNVIEQVNIFGNLFEFGSFAGVVSVFWIVALTNAINLIDGLDGLSCGVSAIASVSLFISLLSSDTPITVIIMTAILAGSCIGFLPFNFNPAKIFMGDTGSLFLGYTMSVLSIQGCFKFNAMVSFIVPFLTFALPLVDTAFAVIRRLLTGKSPFSPDRGHLHHRLIDKGFDQRHSVLILYAVSGISGISAILFSMQKYVSGVIMIAIAIAVLYLNMLYSKEMKENDLHQDDIAK